jgi:hypothetical protein
MNPNKKQDLKKSIESIPQDVVDEKIRLQDEENAPFNRQTMIQAPEGQTISGEFIKQAVEENKRTKKPIGKIIQRLISEAKVITIISPGRGGKK